MLCICTRWDHAKNASTPDHHEWEPGEDKCPDTPARCCAAMYVCPSSGTTECATHGGFDTCCDDPTCPGTVETPEQRDTASTPAP